MANDINLQRGIEDLSEYLPDEIIARYQQTRFRTPSNLERSVQPFIRQGVVGFTINNYAQFLDEGTRYITAEQFIQPVINDENGMIEEILTIAFETDIDDAIEEATKQGGATVT